MTKVAYKRNNCYIKSLLLLCKHGHFFEKKIENSVFFFIYGFIVPGGGRAGEPVRLHAGQPPSEHRQPPGSPQVRTDG